MITAAEPFAAPTGNSLPRILGPRNTGAPPRPLVAKRHDTILLLDCDGSILYASPSISRMLGYSPEDLIGRNELDLVHPDDQPLMRTVFAESLTQSGKDRVVQCRYRHKDTSWHYLEGIRSTRIMDTNVRVIAILERDITARKQSEEVVRAIEAQYRCMIDNLEQSVFLKDDGLHYIAANNTFCQAIGRAKAEIVGKTDFEFYPRPQAEKYHLDDARVLNEGHRVEVEEQIPVDGRMRTFRIVRTPVKDEQGRITGVLGISWDVTEQRNLEAQLLHAQKMEVVGQLAGGMAHDFNNLLTAILGNIALTLGTLPADDSNRELLLSAEHAAVRASELTKRLLGFSRQTIIRPKPITLQACVEEAVRILNRTIDPRITLEVRSTPELWSVLADSGQMNQVLINLCLNSRDAMPEGGRLRLQIDNVVLSEEHLSQHMEARSGEFVRLSVEDSGHGIPAEIRPRIFEPFFTTKEPGKGTSLGLAMVFGIVKQHQGWIDCHSEVNSGTRFSVYLPRSSQAASSPLPPALNVPLEGRETVLLVDDEPALLALGRSILTRYGYEVLLAEDGWQAIEIYRREKGRIDLVILDLTMPRLSGQDTFRQLTTLDPGVRVLFASGYFAEHVSPEEQALVLGFLNKPYRPEELAGKVRSVLDRIIADSRPSPGQG